MGGWRTAITLVAVVAAAVDAGAFSCSRITAPPGALFLPPDAPIVVGFTGNAFLIDGDDHALDGTPGPATAIPGIATHTEANADVVRASLDPAQIDDVRGAGGVPSVAVASGPEFDAVALDDFLLGLLTRSSVVTLYVPTVSGNARFGASVAPQVTHVISDLVVGATGNLSGFGVLVVDGDLTVHGTFAFAGLVVVRGSLAVGAEPGASLTADATVFGSAWAAGLELAASGSAVLVYSSEALADVAAVTLCDVCGDGVVQFPEQCDDGGTAPGDCCSPRCTFEPAGTPCGEPTGQCLVPACDGGGACVAGNAPDGTPCDAGIPDACSLPDVCHAGTCHAGGGGDPDGDGVCDADDDCPSVANASQADLDGDGIGDACDAADAPLTVARVRLRAAGATTNGAASVKGELVVASAADAVTLASGVGLRLDDALSTAAGHRWAPSECGVSASGRIACRSVDGAAKLKLRPSPRAPAAYRFAGQLRRLAIQSPFAGPVLVTVSYGAGIDRAGAVAACVALRGAGLGCTS